MRVCNLSVWLHRVDSRQAMRVRTSMRRTEQGTLPPGRFGAWLLEQSKPRATCLTSAGLVLTQFPGAQGCNLCADPWLASGQGVQQAAVGVLSAE